MRISGHSYNNDITTNMIENMVKQSKEPSKTDDKTISGMNIFSSTVESDLEQVQIDHLHNIYAELNFAANKIGIECTEDDLIRFASKVGNLRGKKLERAAHDFCVNLASENAEPQGAIYRTAEYLSSMDAHSVIPAGYPVEYGPGDKATGRPLGALRNNTMTDPNSLAKLAQTERSDEQTAKEKQDRAEKLSMSKKAMWDRLSDGAEKIFSKGIQKTSGAPNNESSFNPTISNNHMSIFSSDRDFEGVGENDISKKIREASQNRSNKKSANRGEWDQTKAPENTRSAIDRLFEGWLKK